MNRTRVDYTTEGFDKDALVPISQTQTPVCRTCYLRSLPHDEMVRIAAEPITMPVHYCPEHQQRANEIDHLFAKMVAEGKVVFHGSVTGRTKQFPEFRA